MPDQEKGRSAPDVGQSSVAHSSVGAVALLSGGGCDCNLCKIGAALDRLGDEDASKAWDEQYELEADREQVLAWIAGLDTDEEQRRRVKLTDIISAAKGALGV